MKTLYTATLKKLLKGKFMNVKEFLQIINTDVSPLFNSEIICSVQIVCNGKLLIACKTVLNPQFFEFTSNSFLNLRRFLGLHPANTKRKEGNFYTLYCINEN